MPNFFIAVSSATTSTLVDNADETYSTYTLYLYPLSLASTTRVLVVADEMAICILKEVQVFFDMNKSFKKSPMYSVF